MMKGKSFFDQPIKNYLKTSGKTPKITTGHVNDQTTGCFLDYNYFIKHYKMIAIDLSKQQELDADPKAKQQSNFTGKLSDDNNRIILFIIKEAKETILDFS